MKKAIHISVSLLLIAVGTIISHRAGFRAGQRSARIEELTRHACHVACDLGRLRRSGYSDTNHLYIMELSLNTEVAKLADLTRYEDIVHRDMLGIVAGYRQQYPFTLKPPDPDPNIKGSLHLAQYHETSFQNTKEFLTGVTCTQDHLYRDEGKEGANKMNQQRP